MRPALTFHGNSSSRAAKAWRGVAVALCLWLGASTHAQPSAGNAAAVSVGAATATSVEAQAPAAVRPTERGQRVWRAIGWSLLILVAAVVLIVVGMWFRRRWIGAPSFAAGVPAGFSLSDLRQLHRDGQISDEEYEATRARIVDATQRALAREAADAPPPDAPRTKDIDLIREVE